MIGKTLCKKYVGTRVFHCVRVSSTVNKMASANKHVGGGAETYFAKKLASNEKTVRDKAVKKLRMWISTRRSSGVFVFVIVLNTGFSYDVLQIICKKQILKIWFKTWVLDPRNYSGQVEICL